MRTNMLLAIALLSLPIAADNFTLAKVNGEAVTSTDVVNLFSDRHSGHAKFLGGNAEAREFLKIVIDDRLLVQEAYALGLDQSPDVQRLASELEAKRSEEYLIRQEIDEKAKPSKADVKKVWDEVDFVYQVRQIAVDTKQEAEEIRNAILQGTDIELFARDCSRVASRTHGGHQIVTWGEMEPAWERVVFALQPGEISPVMATKNGYEVVLVENRVEFERPPLEKVFERIEGVLLQRRLEERKQQFSDELWSKYHVVVLPVAPDAAPDTVVATWDGGGKLLLKDAGKKNELRPTINAPLVALEAKARNIAATPAIADEVRKYREYLIEGVLFRDHIFKELAITDDENRRYYDEHKSEFVAPEERKVSQILSSSEKGALAVRQQLAGWMDFVAAVRKFSKDPVSATQDGDLGWITPNKVPAAFKDVLALKQGEMSKPISSPGGWHIIKVMEIKPAHQLAFDEVREKVKAKVLDDKRKASRAYWVEKLRAAASIEIDDAAIKEFVKANEYNGNAPPQHALQ